MFTPSRFQGMKKLTQQVWNTEKGWEEIEIDFIRDGFNYLSETGIRVQYRDAIVSANASEVSIQDPAPKGTPWHGFRYNQAQKMTPLEFMNSEDLRRAYPDIAEYLVGIGAASGNANYQPPFAHIHGQMEATA